MWAALFTALSNGFFQFVLMPLFSKWLVSLEKARQEKKADSEKKEEINAAIKEYEEAPDVAAQKAAFKRIRNLRGL